MKSNLEIIKEVFSIFKNNWIKFLMISGIYWAALKICELVIRLTIGVKIFEYELLNVLCVSILFSASIIIFVVVVSPLHTGVLSYFLHISRNEQVSLKTILIGYKKYFYLSMCIDVLMWIFIFLWSCLLLIPGAIKSCSYAMTKIIALDTAKQGALELITDSRKLMDGYKGEFFILILGINALLFFSLFIIGGLVFYILQSLLPSVRTFFTFDGFSDFIGSFVSIMSVIIGTSIHYLATCIFYRELKKEHIVSNPIYTKDS